MADNLEYFAHGRGYAGRAVTIDRAAIHGEIQSRLDLLAQRTGNGKVAVSSRGARKDDDTSIYTGAMGAAVMHLHLYCKFVATTDHDLALLHLYKALHIVEHCRPAAERAKGEGAVGFYVGSSGFFAVAAVVNRLLSIHLAASGRDGAATEETEEQEGGPNRTTTELNDRSHRDFQSLLAMQPIALRSEAADEILFGRAGYLYCLCFVTKYGFDVPASVVTPITSLLVSRGANFGDNEYPLRWHCYRQWYLGAAHGTSGICYMLLCWFHCLASDDERRIVRRTVDVLVHKFALGPRAVGLPASDSQESDPSPSHHWCHGYPGFIPLLAKCAAMFPDGGSQRLYVTAAKRCAEVVFEQGMLRKGLGLCHGAFGNAYCFLTVYKLTRDQRFLSYAVSFFELSLQREANGYARAVATYSDPQRRVQGVPDMPYSLMEGAAGEVCFLADLLRPDAANFPGFETTTAPPTMEWAGPALRHPAAPALNLWCPPPKDDDEGAARAALSRFGRFNTDASAGGAAVAAAALPPPDAIARGGTGAAKALCPGVWSLDMMDPAFCGQLLDAVYSSAEARNAKDGDAIRLGSEFTHVVNGVASVVQRFVDETMIPAKPSVLTAKPYYDRVGDKMAGGNAAANDEDDDDCFPAQRTRLMAAAGKATPPRFELDGVPRLATADTLSGGDDDDDRAHQRGATVDLTATQRTQQQHMSAASAAASLLPRLQVWRAYVIHYREKAHPSIQTHTDACDVTFNLCLRRTCRRGQLVFNKTMTSYKHKEGEAVVFWGDEPHHTHNVIGDGERAQMVLLFNWQRNAQLNPHVSRMADSLHGAIPSARLNHDVIGVILSFLDMRDQAVTSYANRAFYAASSDEELWRERYMNHTAVCEFCPVAFLTGPPPVCQSCGQGTMRRCPNITVDSGSSKPHVLAECEMCHKYHHIPADMELHVAVHCASCSAGPNSAAMAADDDRVPRFMRLSVSSAGDKAQAARRRFRFAQHVSLMNGGWKQAYRSALTQAAMAQEDARQAAKHEKMMFMRAIIGCYSVHDLTQHLRGQLQGKAAKEGDDDFEPCVECGMNDDGIDDDY